MLCVKKMSRHGFTLLETMLSVALLMIVSLMVYEGFMATLNYAADTALAERFSNKNAGTIYSDVASKTNSSMVGGTSTEGILITGSSFKSVIQVNPEAVMTGDSGFSSSTLMQDDNFKITTRRHGFYYVPRTCPDHPGVVLQYFKEGAGADASIVAKCPKQENSTKCTYAVNVRPALESESLSPEST